jgi:glycosyltransferase involved in cell wall biosynthesis
MKSTISVIIPNYNRATLIGETLNNMLRQTRRPDEIIVVDDGSTDESVSVIRGFGNRVTLLRQPNSGPGVARMGTGRAPARPWMNISGPISRY